MVLRGSYSIPAVREVERRNSGVDRRKICFLGYLPERRSGRDRRRTQDKGSRKDPSNFILLERDKERYQEFLGASKGLLLAILFSLPFWALIAYLIFRKG